MEEQMTKVINGAKEAIEKIYETINRIETCEALLGKMKNASILIVMESGEPAEVHPAISEDQEAKIILDMVKMIEKNMQDGVKDLKKLQGSETKKDEEEPEEKQIILPEAIKSKKPEEKKEEKEQQKKGMNVDTVKQMLKDGYNVHEIAVHFGYKSDQTVHNFIEKNNINKAVLMVGPKRALEEKDIPQIKALYTNGPFGITETAAELGTSKKILHEFVTKHHLVKISK